MWSVSNGHEAKCPVNSDCYVFAFQITPDDKGRKQRQSGAENQNQCYYCNQVFQNANSLRRHCRQAHGKDRCHVCGVCNKAFKRATHLKVGRTAPMWAAHTANAVVSVPVMARRSSQSEQAEMQHVRHSDVTLGIHSILAFIVLKN